MRRLISVLILCFVICGCRNERNRNVVNRFADYTADTTQYPLIIESGSKMVYQFGHLTADKGLKLYFDTISFPAGGLYLDDSVRQRLSTK